MIPRSIKREINLINKGCKFVVNYSGLSEQEEEVKSEKVMKGALKTIQFLNRIASSKILKEYLKKHSRTYPIVLMSQRNSFLALTHCQGLPAPHDIGLFRVYDGDLPDPDSTHYHICDDTGLRVYCKESLIKLSNLTQREIWKIILMSIRTHRSRL